MHTAVKRAIIAHAQSIPHEEVCGLVYQDGDHTVAMQCANVSPDDRAHSFEIDPQDYLRARELGRVCAVYHSHPVGDAFSEEDLAVAREMGLPMHLHTVDTGKWSTYVPPTYHVDLVGRPWAWGEADCYATVRDYYRQTLAIYLTDFDRDESLETTQDPVFEPHLVAEGFARLADHAPILTGDMLMFRMPGQKHAGHLAIYIGGNQMLHHRRDQLSLVEAMDGVWLRRLVGVCRHKGALS